MNVDLSMRRRARWLVLAAVLLWSTSGLFAKSGNFGSWPAEDRGLLFGFWRAVFACVVLAPFVRGPRWNWRLIPMTASFSAMNVTFLCALVLTTAANGIWLQSTAPIWVFLFVVFFLRHTPTRLEWFVFACCGAGIAVILFNQIAGADRVGIAMGLLAGVSYAGVLLCLRWLRDENAAWLVAVNHLVAALAVLPIIAWRGAWIVPTPTQFAILAAFGALQMGLPYVLLTRGLRTISSWEAATIGLLEPILMPIWVYLAFRETPARSTFAGAALILVGLAASAIGPRWTRRPKHPGRSELPGC